MTEIDQSIGPGFLGFVVTFALAIACVILFRSLTRHLRKVKRDAERESSAD